jgi:hypothetical protein
MIAAYREPHRDSGRELMRQLIGSVSRGVPGALKEIITLGRTLQKRSADVLAYFPRRADPVAVAQRTTAPRRPATASASRASLVLPTPAAPARTTPRGASVRPKGRLDRPQLLLSADQRPSPAHIPMVGGTGHGCASRVPDYSCPSGRPQVTLLLLHPEIRPGHPT